jgi:hypothetical protein
VLANIPEIWPELKWIWEGFHTLSASRQRGFSGPQPLLLMEILAYASGRPWDLDDREEFLHYIQFLDGIFMKVADDRAAANAKKK